jgi:hypothetical protein
MQTLEDTLASDTPLKSDWIPTHSWLTILATAAGLAHASAILFGLHSPVAPPSIPQNAMLAMNPHMIPKAVHICHI